MDVLTDVLSTMRVSSVLYGRIEAAAPWGISFTVQHVLKFCLVARGSCYLTMAGGEPVALSEGDFVLTSSGAKYSICDFPGNPTRPIAEILHGAGRREGRTDQGVNTAIQTGGKGLNTSLVNGLLAFDTPDKAYFLDLLPQLIIIRQEQAERLGFAIYMQRLSIESADPSPGAQLVANWLGGIVFVHALRAYAALENGKNSGWLGALSDRKIAIALDAMHQQLAHAWTVQQLAELAGMSRSGFAEWFKRGVGKAPLDYLTDWRMHVAKRALWEGKQKLSQIAADVGYGSDTAFSKAFKSRTGTTPTEYRALKSQQGLAMSQ